MIEPKFLERITAEVSARLEQVAAAIPLFDKGATIPFVARYRKDATGNLDDGTLEKIEERNTYYIALTSRRNAILENIAKQDKLSDELRQRLEACYDQAVLEDLYLPFKKQRRTKATMAMDQGLEPLADFLWTQAPINQPLEEFAQAFVKPEKLISSPEEALLGACNILAERAAIDSDARLAVRDRMTQEGRIVTAATKNAQGQKTKFEAFYDFSESLKNVSGAKLLAILRGVRLGFLRMDLVIDDAAMIEQIVAHFLKNPGSVFEAPVRQFVEDAYKRLLRPAIENEVVAEARKAADEEAIQGFRKNAEAMLTAPAAGPITILGLLPASQGPWGLAVAGSDGTFLEGLTFSPTAEADAADAPAKVFGDLISKHHVQGIAIGDGDGARDAARFVGTTLKSLGLRRTFWVFIDSNCAALYSASKEAKQELPEADATVRTALSLARRLQDPLAELVKLEPRALASGQYLHDVNQRHLREAMTHTVEFCVNWIGVDLNTASVELLRYVSGIQMGTAQNIIEQRAKIGGFTSKAQLLEVPGIGEKTYEQCAGFLRIHNAANPVDATRIHPEAASVVERMAAQAGTDVASLFGNEELVHKVNLKDFVSDTIGEMSLADIRTELIRPGADPRVRFRAPRYVDGAYTVAELQEGAEAEGIISSITDFGVFVDIGVGQDGLVHLSELANHFIREPRGLFRIGDTMRVKVIKVDHDQRRISLSRKALLQPPRRRPLPPKPGEEAASAPGVEQDAAARPERPPYGGRPRPEGPSREGRRPSSAPSHDGRRTEGVRDNRRPDSGGDRRRDKPGRKAPQGRPNAPAAGYGDIGDLMNTQLADQLAALREKLDS